MPELKNWENNLVIQRDTELGCIPAGYEWMIRMLGIEGVKLDDFQEKFNLERKTKGHENEIKNNFESVANAVMQKYPQVKITYKKFNGKPGREKIAKIEELINANTPCLISIAYLINPNTVAYHTVPAIYIDSKKLKVIWRVDNQRVAEIREFLTEELIRRHENWRGGDDIAWMEKV